MPELFFKGKEFVYNHHLAVPFRPLIPDPRRSVGASGENGRLDGNLIIHGDNLHALKALLPLYAGKVDCIFIDPPYNTGNEGWCYNDNVSSPMMKEWLAGNPVGIEDGLRHDKWLAMMWPRLRLLHDLLSERGTIWITLDDNEVHRAKLMMDEIFGKDHFIANLIWEKTTSARNDAILFSSDHDHLLVYCRSPSAVGINRVERTKSSNAAYSNPDDDPRGDWREGDYKCAKSADERPNLYYPITNPFTGRETWPRQERVWAYSKEETAKNLHEGRLWWGKDGNYSFPKLKRFRCDAPAGLVPRTLWKADEVEQTRTARTQLQEIFSDNPFPTPKPVELVSRIVELATDDASIVLDSFAGSGTTAHAVLAVNKKDNGARKFILVECEDYAEKLTAERVRRVINGYSFKGTQREELHRERLTFGSLKKADKLLDHVESIKHLEAHRFDRIKAEVKDGELIVTGEREVTQKTQGLGGEFSYCTLGAAIEIDRLLTGEHLPGFEQLGSLLFHMATNEARPAATEPEEVAGCGYLGATSALHLWLIYRPELAFLKSREAALTLSRAEAIARAKPDRPHLVFAPARFVSQQLLKEAKLPVPVEFAPLPFALYRIERS